MKEASDHDRTAPGTPPTARPGSGVDVATVLGLAASVDEPAVLATVLEARGSVPQVRGAMLLVTGEVAVGTVGGGAAEAKTLVACRAVLADGRSTEVDIDLAGHPGEVRDGVCGGRMRIAIDPLDPSARAVFAEAATRIASGVDVDLQATRATADRTVEWRIAADEDDVAGAIHIPGRPVVIVVGAGHCGLALERLGRFVGRRMIVVDDRLEDSEFRTQVDPVVEAATSIPEAWSRLPDPVRPDVALVTRNFAQDVAALEALRHRRTGRVGMMGSRRRVATVLDALEVAGWTPSEIGRIKSPIGLDIGGVTPEEIAVSIMAELIGSNHGD
ncbi:MAG: XdhC family protein [Planctomycetota bacterium]|jgi:xanthine dehydrogenase accessory factor